MDVFKGLLELRFYLDDDEPMVYVKYLDDNMSKKTLRVKQKHIGGNLGKDVTELSERIVSKYDDK